MPYLPWNVTLSPDDVFLATAIAHTTCGPEMVDVYRRRACQLWSKQGDPDYLDQEGLRRLMKLHRRTVAMADAIETLVRLAPCRDITGQVFICDACDLIVKESEALQSDHLSELICPRCREVLEVVFDQLAIETAHPVSSW